MAPFLAVAGLARAQQQASSEKPIELATVTFTVSDHQGHPVKDLTIDQIAILDNGQPPKRVAAFGNAGAIPLRLGIVIDKSNSMREDLAPVLKALGPFAVEIIRPDSDKVFVLAFDEALYMVGDFTSDPSSLTARINSVRAGGGSSLWDAIYFACREKLAREQVPSRLVLVLVSDVDDNQSRVTRKDAVEMAERAGVVIYVVSPGFGSGSLESPGARPLAEKTGGRAFFPSNAKKLNEALAAIEEEVRAQYYIAYMPGNLQHDGQHHSIRISPGVKELKVRAREGYVAPKP